MREMTVTRVRYAACESTRDHDGPVTDGNTASATRSGASSGPTNTVARRIRFSALAS
jgi:hypothetical protein